MSLDDNRNYVYKKEVDWSLLQEGLTLPFGNQVVFGQIMGRFLKRGESKDIMTIVIKSDAGTGPNDLVAIVISDKSKIRFGIMRIIVDFTFVLIGALLGGIFGVGTIVCAFLVGPVADFFLPKNEKIINRILMKF